MIEVQFFSIMFANKLRNILTLVNMFVVCRICYHSYTFFCIVLLHFILNIQFLNGGLNEYFDLLNIGNVLNYIVSFR
jgi:hypothetical protein